MAAYRATLKELGRPEASEVDIALAAATTAYAATVDKVPRGTGNFQVALNAILRGTVSILVRRGCTREQAVAMVRWRVSPETRKDIAALVHGSNMAKRLAVT